MAAATVAPMSAALAPSQHYDQERHRLLSTSLPGSRGWLPSSTWHRDAIVPLHRDLLGARMLGPLQWLGGEFPISRGKQTQGTYWPVS